MDPIVAEFKSFTRKVLDQLKEDLKTIRTGKANPALVEGITVETYGGTTKLPVISLATVAPAGPSMIAIIPFDPSTSKDIEKAILKSPLGLNPQPQGNQLLINIPPLSQEQREKLIKALSAKIEEKKVMMRNERDNARRKIKQSHEQKTVTDDDKFRLEKDVDTVIQEATEEINQIRDKKEQEMREV